MITAVDSNVLIDVLSPEPTFGEASRRALHRCLSEGGLAVCEVVVAEVTARFNAVEEVERRLHVLGVTFAPLEFATAAHAGAVWGEYLEAGGRRGRIVADFLVGAHAMRQADRLLTRDRGFYRRYFGDLEVVDPSEG
jgi:hypothetical protein